MWENAETATDVLTLLKTIDNDMAVCLGSPKIVNTTVKGKAHLSLSWWHEGETVCSRTMASNIEPAQIRKNSMINALGYFRDFRPNTAELWKSLNSVRRRKSYQAEGVSYYTQKFDDRSLNIMRETIETYLESQIALQSLPIAQIFVDERRGIITGPKYTAHHMSLEESEVIANCFNNMVLPTLELLWDIMEPVRVRLDSMVAEELKNGRRKFERGKSCTDWLNSSQAQRNFPQ